MLSIFIEKLIIADFIRQEESEIVEFGLRQGISSFIGIIVALLVGSAMGIFLQSFIFIFTFIPLRMYAGGFHANTQFGCAIISFLLMLFSFQWINQWTLSEIGTLLLGFIEIVILFILIPVNGSYQLDDAEKYMYKKKGHKILLLETILFCGMSIINCDIFTRSIVATLSVVLLLAILGIMKENYS